MENTKPPVWFWIVVSLLLLWNILGIIALVGQINLNEDALALMTPEEQEFYRNMPMWVTWAFGLAVFAGFLGCVGLLARRRWARPLLIASLIGVIIQIAYNLIAGNGLQVYGGLALLMPAFTLAVSIFLVWLAGHGTRKHWLL